jgi:hypothetical protein
VENGFEALKTAGHYKTMEAEILRDFTSPVSWISEERGLELVREACNKLEIQVAAFRERRESATEVARTEVDKD